MNRTTKFLVLAALGMCVAAMPAVSQEAAKDAGGEVWVLEPAEGGILLADLLTAVAEVTDVPIVYDPASPLLKQKVKFLETVRVPRDEVFRWLQSVLVFSRIVLVPIGPGRDWMVKDLNDPMAFAHPTYVPEAEIEEWKDRDGVYIVSTVRLNHLKDTTRARNALAQLSTRAAGRVNDVPNARAVVIGDYAPVVYSMWKLLKAMDVEEIDEPALAAPRGGAASPSARGGKSSQVTYYEGLLAKCQTAAAAQYFLNRIQEILAE